jgi:hypothetical protein
LLALRQEFGGRLSETELKKPRKDKRSPSPAVVPGFQLKPILVKALMFVLFGGILGIGLTLFRMYTDSKKPLHSFSAKEQSDFVSVLKARGVPAHSVWLACPVGREDICQQVRQFVVMFNEAGWRVEQNRVNTWNPAHPLGGVHLILNSADRIDSSDVKNAFLSLGIPVQAASAPDVQRNSIGIFFGPDL